MITKEQLKLYIDSFPEKFTIDELIERLIFVEKLENRIELSKSQTVISEDDLKSNVKKWFK